MNEASRFEPQKFYLYLLIAFGWSWLLWLPSVIITVTDNQSLMYWMYDIEMTFGLGLIAIAGIFSTFGPFVAAFSVTGLTEGREGVRRLWGRFWDARLPGAWLWISILIPFLLIALPRFIVIPPWIPASTRLGIPTSRDPGMVIEQFHPLGGHERGVRLARFCLAATPGQVERVGLQPDPGRDLGRVAPTALVPRRFFAAGNVFLALPGQFAPVIHLVHLGLQQREREHPCGRDLPRDGQYGSPDVPRTHGQPVLLGSTRPDSGARPGILWPQETHA